MFPVVVSTLAGPGIRIRRGACLINMFAFEIEIAGGELAQAAASALEAAFAEFPGLPPRIVPAPADVEPVFRWVPPRLTVPLATWAAPAFDPADLEAGVPEDAPLEVRLVADAATAGPDLAWAAGSLLTRLQHRVPRRNAPSAEPAWAALLAAHRALHHRGRPLVAADFVHALDTWQWLLRLAPGAGDALQAAALLHDIERLGSEAEVRIEQHAPDYAAFKDDHAGRSARVAAALLGRCGFPAPVRRRTAELVAAHERGGDDPELALLADADALSFFSLNASGFLRYYGADHARRKIAHTLDRMRPQALSRLAGIKLCAGIAALLAEERAHRAARRGGRAGAA